MNDCFRGWYYKCQSKDHTVALIPAVNYKNGTKSALLQIISDIGRWNIPIDGSWIRVEKRKPVVYSDNLVFSEKGFKLNLQTNEISVVGTVRFDALSPIKYDIMGPFKFVPFMECRHSVVSMRHMVNGDLEVGEADFSFEDGTGYIEGDMGRSFPKRYVWSHCSFENGSLMLSAAEIPFGPLSFTGVICIIVIDGIEYRMATYLGAYADKIKDNEIVIRQGGAFLRAKLLDNCGYQLKAPQSGGMSRMIHENISCHAAYDFCINGRGLLSFETTKASFEFEYR